MANLTAVICYGWTKVSFLTTQNSTGFNFHRVLGMKRGTTVHCSGSLSCINEYPCMDMCTSSHCPLIVAYGWMFPRKVEVLSD